jgi:hypothetical protein
MTSNKKKIDLIAIGAAATMIFGPLMLPTFANMGYAQATSPQPPSSLPAANATLTMTTFTDDTGFTVYVPQGWLAVDDNNTIDTVAKAEADLGFTVLAEFCPEDQGQFLTSGTPFCGGAEHRIFVHKYKDFASDPDFLPYISSRNLYNITAQDAMTYWLNVVTSVSQPNKNILQIQDVLLNGSSSSSIMPQQQEQEQQQMIPAKLVHYTYEKPLREPNSPSKEVLGMYLVVNNNSNNGTVGYDMEYERNFNPDVPIAEEVKQLIMSARFK